MLEDLRGMSASDMALEVDQLNCVEGAAIFVTVTETTKGSGNDEVKGKPVGKGIH